MNLELLGALNELEKERGISREVLIEAIEDAIQSALRRSSMPHQNLRVDFDERSGRVRVFARKAVVRQVADAANEISLEEAQRINPRFEVDDVVEVELTLPDLGRIAAQTAKQVVVQRIREAERNRIYDEFHSREGDILTGIIRRIEHRTVYVDLGRAEGVMPPSEQVPTERYAPGVRMKLYLAEVRKTTKGPQILLSRSHPGLLKRLFELEVPEIHDGVVEIRAWAREPGHRSKIAVWSTDRNVDPVGACVGPRGARVQQVVKELRQEKVDVIAWDPDPEVFIANALQPARALKVYLDPEERSARVIVPEMQLSLAIGKEGQNARLAARLTGWRIDIKGEAQWAEVEREVEERRLQRLQAELEARTTPEVPAARTAGETVRPAGAPGELEPAAVAVAGPMAAEGATVGAREEEYTEEAAPPRLTEEERSLRVKGGGKARRLKGVRRLERRHLEEAIEESEALPSLFGPGEEQKEPVQAGAAVQDSTPAAPDPQAQEPADAGLSVRLIDLMKPQPEREPKKAAPAQDAGTRASGSKGSAGDGAAGAATTGTGGERARRSPGRLQGPRAQAPQQEADGRSGQAAARRGDGRKPGRPAAAGDFRPAPASGEGQEKPRSRVLKSLSELSFEDFGFPPPAPKKRGS